jgi:hypothetical protein
MPAPVATAFFVGVGIADDAYVVYVVTARHVIERAETHGSLYLRLNRRSGGVENIELADDIWTSGTDSDVAVASLASLPVALDEFDVIVIPFDMLSSNDWVAEKELQEGDEIFFASLFEQHPGQERNLPILRFGTIALMPGEKIRVKDIGLVYGYLVEARSWGGHSGSPAFIYLPATRHAGMLATPSVEGPVDDESIARAVMPRLFGLISAHFNIPTDVKVTGDFFGSAVAPVNAGIAVVTPAQKIIDLLMEEELVEDRDKAAREQEEQRPAAEPDTANGVPDSEDEPISRDEFLRDLGRVSRPIEDEKPPQGTE